MKAAFVIAAKDLRQRVRDRSALVIGIIAPVVIAGVMALAFGSSASFHYTLAVVDQDHGIVSAGVIQALRQPALADVVSLRPYSSADAASAAVKSGKVQAGLVIPPGFSASMTGASPLGMTTLSSVDQVMAASVTTSLVRSFAAQLNADRLAFTTAVAAGALPSPALQAAVAKLTIPLQVVQQPLGARAVSAIGYFSPAMATFFLLFIISYTARSFFVERSQGTVERMRASPVRPLAIVAGKALSVLVFGGVSLATVAVITSAAFGAYWGSPLPVATVCLALVVAVMCLTTLVIGLARTQRQAEGVASLIVFGLALLGGNFMYVSAAPSIMRRLALLTPNGWAMRAFMDLSTTGGGFRTIAEPVLAIAVFSAIVGALAVALAPRAVA
ncbi:MAG TPA: ABC transporter permease [Acidimicrobiales bacterium]|nr:ABC transporter permease [Acidimicrobiales bacterium]